MIAPPTLPAYGVGVDYSTKRIHIAVVSREEVAKVHIARIEGMDHSERVTALAVAFDEVRHCEALRLVHGPVAVVENPFVGKNDSSAIILSILMGELIAVAVLAGFGVLRMTASEWRGQVGIKSTAPRSTRESGHRGGQPMRHLNRADLKAEALRLVKLMYGVDFGKDDNAAESVLMAGVALTQARERALLAVAS